MSDNVVTSPHQAQQPSPAQPSPAQHSTSQQPQLLLAGLRHNQPSASAALCLHLPRAMAKTGEVVLSATERMLVEKQKMEIKRMRMSKVVLINDQ